VTDLSLNDVTTRPETNGDEDKAFLRRLFCSLDQVQPLLQMGGQAELLIDMQLKSREQQYRAMHPGASFELILANGEPIGRLATDCSATPWTLIDIAILPDFRGHQIGTHLVGKLLQSADSSGANVRASVHADNLQARRLWLSLGFQVTEERLDYWSLLYSPDQVNG
jgi:ribosomal protein S18 acetylase RimI-like enzyme